MQQSGPDAERREEDAPSVYRSFYLSCCMEEEEEDEDALNRATRCTKAHFALRIFSREYWA